MLGLGAVLTQCDDERKEFMVAYVSRSNNAAESHYSSYEGDCLVAVWAVAHFRCYLFGTQFTLVTNHQPLKWLMESDKLRGKLAHWVLILQEYDFEVVHKPGVGNLDADGLSRNPCTSQEDNTGAKWHGEVDEEMVPSWYASAFLCLLGVDSSMEGHMTSYYNQRVDGQSSNPKVRDGSTNHHDVHDDTLVLEFLRTNMVPRMVNAKERDHVFQQARKYRLEGTHILRVWEDGRVRIVPHPTHRGHIVRHAHEELGHFGVKRTYNLLLGQYWWRGMHTDVQRLVSHCIVCDKVRASFNTRTPQLHPLLIMGLGYRWSLDFAGPLPLMV